MARAIRLAYPHARTVGVSYAGLGAGIQWPDLDKVWDVGPWAAKNLADHRREIGERLATDAWWISGLPQEVEWLSQVLAGHERVLVPPMPALEQVRLPAIPAAAALKLGVPSAIRATAPDWDLNAFARRHGWRVWLRMLDGSSRQLHSWQAFHQARVELGAAAFSDDLFLQEHIQGIDEAIGFAAYQGTLLGCALRLAEEVPPTGGPRSSRVEEVPEPLVASLAHALQTLRWTGGGELRLVRDPADQHWALGWRACFPTWMFGAALAGHNLAAQLLERVTGETAAPPTEMTDTFVRVVIEVPIRRLGDGTPSAPHPSSAPESVAMRRRSDANATIGADDSPANSHAAEPQIAGEILRDVASATCNLEETPAWLFLPNAARSAFHQAEDLVQRFSTPDVRVQIAYSVKTNPEPRLLELAVASGLLAETISQSEVKKAMTCGFSAGRIVLNGPAKRWPAPNPLSEPLHAVFCDSLEELHTAVAAAGRDLYHADVLGVRLRTPRFASRFGIPIETAEAAEEIGALVRRLPSTARFGMHFHMASNAIGLDSWWQLFTLMLDRARAIETAGGRAITCLDVGGGWFPDDWTDELSQRFGEQVMQRLVPALPHVCELILEPGRALAQSSMALAVRVLEARRGADGQIGDVVVDGSIAELAYHNYSIFPHRMLWHDPAVRRWGPLGRGPGRILGRLCMEKDILAEAIGVPPALAAGDLLVICDAGAYDRSMSYSFGRG